MQQTRPAPFFLVGSVREFTTLMRFPHEAAPKSFRAPLATLAASE
jgi:hypothetical protein